VSPRFARPSTNTIVRLRRARPQHNIAAIRWPRLKVPLQSPFDSTSCRLQIAVFGLNPPPHAPVDCPIRPSRPPAPLTGMTGRYSPTTAPIVPGLGFALLCYIP